MEKSNRLPGYYWIKLVNEDAWQVSYWDVHCGWHITGKLTGLPDKVISEIDERRIERDVINLDKATDVLNLRFKTKENEGFEFAPTHISFDTNRTEMRFAIDSLTGLSLLIMRSPRKSRK